MLNNKMNTRWCRHPSLCDIMKLKAFVIHNGRTIMSIQTINPTTGEVLETFDTYSQQQINEALDQAHQAFLQWRTLSFVERGKYLHSIASHLRDHKTELGKTAVLEMGKTITEAEAEVEKCAWNCDYFADNAESFLADAKIVSNANE